jgi:hypothetical protein
VLSAASVRDNEARAARRELNVVCAMIIAETAGGQNILVHSARLCSILGSARSRQATSSLTVNDMGFEHGAS